MESLLTQDRVPDQVVVVVDHNAGLLEHARDRWRDIDDVLVVPNEFVRGLSGARNTGVGAASGDVLAFIDDDAQPVDDRWCAGVLANFSQPGVVAVGGAAIPRWSTAQPSWMPAEFYWTIGCSYKGQPTVRGPVRNVLGCNMAMRASAVSVVGAFETRVGRGHGQLPMGAEETDMCIRLVGAFGVESVIYDPDVVVAHEVAAERTQWSYFVKRCVAEGLSKATLASIAGHDDALSSERTYSVRVLPRGFAREFLGFVIGGHPFGRRGSLGRAGAIVIGFAATTAGFAIGSVRAVLVSAHEKL